MLYDHFSVFNRPGFSQDRKLEAIAAIHRYLTQLRDTDPELFNSVEEQYRSTNGFQREGASDSIPSYCERYPHILSDDIQSFYPSLNSLPTNAECLNFSEFSVNNNFLTIASNIREIANAEILPDIKNIRAEMINSVAANVLEQRAHYGRITGSPRDHFPSCFPASNGEAQGNVSVIDRRPTQSSIPADYNEAAVQAGITQSFNQVASQRAPAENFRQDLLRSSLESTLYQEAIRLYRDSLVSRNVPETNSESFCRIDIALERGLLRIPSPESLSFQETEEGQAFCHHNPLTRYYFASDEACLEEYSGFESSDYDTCVQQNENNTSHDLGHQGATAILQDQMQGSPLLFSRNRGGVTRFSSSPMGTALLEKEGMSSLIGQLLGNLRGGLNSFNETFQAFLEENNEQFEQVYNDSLRDQELQTVIDNEITDYQAALDTSIDNLCETGGANLHHIPELYEQVTERALARSSSPEERESSLVRYQRVQCHLLREVPPEDTGGLPTGLHVLGVGAGIIVSFINPLVGAGILVAVEGTNLALTSAETTAQLEQIIASAHAGFSDQSRVQEANRRQNTAIITGAGSVVLEILSGPVPISLFTSLRRGTPRLNIGDNVLVRAADDTEPLELTLDRVQGDSAFVSAPDGTGVREVPLSTIIGRADARGLERLRLEGSSGRIPPGEITDRLREADPETYRRVLTEAFQAADNNVTAFGDIHIGFDLFSDTQRATLRNLRPPELEIEMQNLLRSNGFATPDSLRARLLSDLQSNENLDGLLNFLQHNRERFANGNIIIGGDILDSAAITNLKILHCGPNAISDACLANLMSDVNGIYSEFLESVINAAGFPTPPGDRVIFQVGNHDLLRTSAPGERPVTYHQEFSDRFFENIRGVLGDPGSGRTNLLTSPDGTSDPITLRNGNPTIISHVPIAPEGAHIPVDILPNGDARPLGIGASTGRTPEAGVTSISFDAHNNASYYDGEGNLVSYTGVGNLGGGNGARIPTIGDGDDMVTSGSYSVFVGDEAVPTTLGFCGDSSSFAGCLHTDPLLRPNRLNPIPTDPPELLEDLVLEIANTVPNGRERIREALDMSRVGSTRRVRLGGSYYLYEDVEVVRRLIDQIPRYANQTSEGKNRIIARILDNCEALP